ncbi:MAG: S1/P1 nuclease [Planctomycetaceae bacterium]|nr:S1/P1 nuclease [Planctomycetaceae bacterium]
MFRTCILVFVMAFPTAAHAWWECGHHIIALLAFEQLPKASQEKLYAILKSHPKFDVDFQPQVKVRNVPRWQIGRTGYWPDVARQDETFNRPTWHYQLGATAVLGTPGVDVEVPDFPGPVPPSASLQTRDLYIAQAYDLCAKVLADETAQADQRALAICWLAHLVGDSHQPCHAGSLYVKQIFPDGDRGANRIKTVQRRNLHALWDSLLGDQFDETDIERRMFEIKNNTRVWTAARRATRKPSDRSIRVWLEESRALGAGVVYATDVGDALRAAQRSGRTELEVVDLSEAYLKNAGRIAQERAAYAAFRLARIWNECL